MKLQIYFLIPFLTAFLFSCSDDNKTLKPSYVDVNWFEIKDGPNETDHLRYEIYTSTGISLFYSDTLGKQFRGYDGFGDSIIHHEILNPYYMISSSSGDISYVFSSNQVAIRQKMIFLRDQVIPLLERVMYPRSFLIVEELTLNASATEAAGNRKGNVYRGMMTTLVSRASEIGAMNATDRRLLAAEIAGELWGIYVEMEYGGKLAEFYAVSDNGVTWPANASTRTTYNRNVMTAPTQYEIPYMDHWNGYGFLLRNPDIISNPGLPRLVYYTPTQKQDVCSFIQAVLLYTEAEFRAQYESVVGFNLLLTKYRLMKELVDTIKINHY